MVVTLEEAKAKLVELIHGQPSGQEVEITENGKSVAKLVVLPKPERKVPRLGTMKGTVLSMERFDEPLEEFEEYM
jgi:antitoxin (DNA-binding transcriptional repressor) of toxin-antitoxin stability system